MDSRERFIRSMHFESVDRVPFYEFLGYWGETVNRWYGEGLPAGMSVYDFFGFDKREGIPIDFGPIPSLITRTVYEDERYRIDVSEGAGLRWKAKVLKTSTSMPLFIEFGVKTREDFERIKRRYDPYDPRRYPKSWGDELMEYYRTIDRPVGMGLPGIFGFARNLMGLKDLLINFYKDPGFIRDMFNFLADFQVEAARKAVEEAEIDYVTLWEDMAYVNGPHISPKQFREFMLPCYKKITGFLRSHGIDIIMVDSDGDINLLIPLFLEGGVNCLYPLEVQSKMDAVALRRKYGKSLLMIGNIDKKALVEGGKAIEREVEYKVPQLIEEGGYIPSVDHAVSADVPFKNYVQYINLLKKHIFKSSHP